MSFVTIELLIAGAGCMAIPIVIHLLSRQRRRPVEWAAMRFLIEALRRSRWRLRLEQILLLAVRCLIPAALGAALARPVLEAAGILDTGGLRVALLVIDDGLASGVTPRAGPGPTALASSIEQAIRIVEELRPGDAVGVITAARPARGLVIPPTGDHGAVVQLLRSLVPRHSPSDLAGGLRVLDEALAELPADRDQTLVFLLSDFRRGQAPLESALPAIGARVDRHTVLLASPPAPDAPRNVQVASVGALRGLLVARADDGGGQVTVELRRGGALESDATRVRLVGEDLPHVEPRPVAWEPGRATASAEFAVDLAAASEQGLALSALIDEDALPADNAHHTVLAARSRVRVLLIDRRAFAEPELDRLGPGPWIRRALEPTENSPATVVEVDPAALEPIDFRGADAAFLVRGDLLSDDAWNAVGEFVGRGGLLVVVPPADAQVHQWTQRLTVELGLPWYPGLETLEHPGGLALAAEQPASELLRPISGELSLLTRPVVVMRSLPLDMERTRADRVMDLADGSPMIIASAAPDPDAGQGSGERGSGGMVVFLAVSPELSWTNLPANPLMVALMHELVRQGVGIVRTSQRYLVGDQPRLGLRASAARLVAPDGAAVTLDAQGRPREPFQAAGVYRIVDQAGQPVGAIAVNVDADAARTDPQSPAAVAEWLQRSGPWRTFDPQDPAAALRTAESGSPLASTLLVAALVLVLLETGLARWFSHAGPAP
jgi:hypothetical protein